MAKKIAGKPSRRDFVKWSGLSGGVILLRSGAILHAEQPSRRIITFDCYGTLIEMRPVGVFLAKLADQHGIDRKAFGSAFGRELDLWLYSAPPREQLRSTYGFEISPGWLDHLMKSSIRFNSGGSGSFVSGDGLVITNSARRRTGDGHR